MPQKSLLFLERTIPETENEQLRKERYVYG